MEIVTVPLGRWSGVEGRPLVLAGPSVAESAELLAECARRLAGARVDFLATEVWRRIPGELEEGEVGARALGWLIEAARRHGLRCATAVADAEQVERALAQGVDLLWIESSTVSHPAAMQLVAHALRGCPVPVLVANPEQNDIGFWIEAFERLATAGVSALGALQVGFPPAGGPHHPSSPAWELTIELRRLCPELPVVSDVSRLSGGRDQVAERAQAVLDLGFEGLMFSAHPAPDHAWHDAERQLLPERVAGLLAAVRVRRASSPAATFNEHLARLRSEIDALDRRLLDLVAERMRVVEAIARLKRSENVASLQVDRWRAALDQRFAWGRERDLVEALVHDLFQAIHGESVRRQGEILDREPDEPER